MVTGPDEMFVMENVNGALISPGLAWYSLWVASHARIFGAMLSPESYGVATAGGTGLFVTFGVGIGVGVGVGAERGTRLVVLQPTNSANDNSAMPTATMLDLSE